jgi:hypothetical protein
VRTSKSLAQPHNRQNVPPRKERTRLLLVSGSFLAAQREQLVALAARYAVPALYHRREFATIGGLMSYGPPLSEAHYHVGDYTGRILKGEKPANMAVYQSTKFDLVINLRTTKADFSACRLGCLAPASFAELTRNSRVASKTALHEQSDRRRPRWKIALITAPLI